MLGNLFKKKKLKNPVDLSGLVTDMHSHLVPGIDDGSPDMDSSVELVREMHKLGYRKLITTPHVSSDIYKNSPETIQDGIAQLQQRISLEGIPVTLQASAEYMIDDGFELLIKENKLQTLGDKYLLIELPYFNVPPNLYDVTFELQIKGFKIILAHPERYLYWYHQMDKFEELRDRGIFFQMNIISLSGQYGGQVKKLAEKLVDLGMIDFLGSDMHNLQYLEIFKASLYEPYLQKIIESSNIKNHLL